MSSVTISTRTLKNAGFVAGATGLFGMGGLALGHASGFALLSALAGGAIAAAGIEFGRRRGHAERVEKVLGLFAGRLEQLSTRVGALEDRLGGLERFSADEGRAEAVQTAAEIEMLGTLVKELAQTVAQHDVELSAAPVMTRDRREFAAEDYDRPPQGRARHPRAEPLFGDPVRETYPRDPEGARLAALIDRAIADGRIELHLQPVVSLPQRRVKFYEALSRIRAVDGTLVAPAEFLPAAEGGGRIAAFDLAVVARAVAVLKRLVARNRDVALFCNLSQASLTAPVALDALVSLLQGHQEIAAHLLIEMSQATLRQLGPAGMERLRPLIALGYRFSMDQVTDLKLDPRALFDQGFRHVKVSPGLLFSAEEHGATEIHPQDLARLLSRNGIQLIALGVEAEKTVLELLDYDVRFGQGFVFSPPRPVRPELAAETAPANRPAAAEAPAVSVPPAPPPAQDDEPPTSGSEWVPYRSVLRRAGSL